MTELSRAFDIANKALDLARSIRDEQCHSPQSGEGTEGTEGCESRMTNDRITAGYMCTFFNRFQQNDMVGIEVLDEQGRRLKIKCLGICDGSIYGIPVITVHLDKEGEAE